MTKRNNPTKICPYKGQVEENRRTLNLNPIPSFPGVIDRRRWGGGRTGRTQSSHFVSVLFKFHQLFGVWPQTKLNLKYCGERPDIFLHLKHVSSYTNSFAECKHNLKERERRHPWSFGGLPRDLEWNNLYDLTFRVLSLSIIFRLWIPNLNITQIYLYGTNCTCIVKGIYPLRLQGMQ